MSKSLGNTADVLEAVARYGGRAIRLYLAGPHYRSSVELSDESLAESAAQLERVDSFLARAAAKLSAVELAGDEPLGQVPADFAAAMDDDLGTPQALAVLFNTVREGNQALDRGDLPAVGAALASVTAMLGVLGLDPAAPEWASAASTDDLTPVVDRLVQTVLSQREQARARKDWASADAIRDALKDAGLTIEDTKDGARWSLGKA